MGCECQCQKPKQENPLDEILSEKDLDKNQLTSTREPNEIINGNIFKNNKPKEIPTQSRFSIENLNDIETNSKNPINFINGLNKNEINNNYVNNVKDSDIVLTSVNYNEKNNNKIKVEEEFKGNDNDKNNNNMLNKINEEKKREKNEEKKSEKKDEKKSEKNEEKKSEKKSIKSDEKKSEKKSLKSIIKTPEKNKEIKNDAENIIPEDDFSRYIYEQINRIRTDPQSYINIIEKSKENIIEDEKNRLIYKSKVKVALSKGKSAFEELIVILQETQPMNPLKFNPKMNVPLPSTIEEIKDKNYIKIKVKELRSQNIYIKSYWKDIIKDPETSFILMVVDDTGHNYGKKRKDILNPQIKYIGISSTFIEKSFVCYMTFSD